MMDTNIWKNCDEKFPLKTSECVRTLNNLRQQEIMMDKSLRTLIAKMKTKYDFGENLEIEQQHLSESRAKLYCSLTKTLLDISNELQSVKSVVENLHTIDIENYKTKLQSLWEKIKGFNTSDFLETLKHEQNVLESEVAEVENDVEIYERKNTCTIMNSEKKRDNDVPNKTSECGSQIFTRFVAKTGHTQNWSDEDHQLFLKLRKTSKNIPALVIAMQEKCPDLSSENIVNHEAWYKTYMCLRQKQKQSITHWQEKRRNEKITSQTSRHSEMRDESVEMMDASVKNEGVEKPRKGGKKEDDGKNIKELIQQWKVEKEKRNLRDEENLKVMLQMKKEIEERNEARAAKIKKKLMEYKRRKVEEANFEKERKETSKRKTEAKVLQFFRNKDQDYIEKRKSSLKNKDESKKHVKQRTSFDAQSTLYKSTKTWEEKCKIENPAEKQEMTLTYIKDLPKMYNLMTRKLVIMIVYSIFFRYSYNRRNLESV